MIIDRVIGVVAVNDAMKEISRNERTRREDESERKSKFGVAFILRSGRKLEACKYKDQENARPYVTSRPVPNVRWGSMTRHNRR